MGNFAGKEKGTEPQVRWKEDHSSVTSLRNKPRFDRVWVPEDHARADQILEQMEESCQRIDRLLKVFDRMR